LQDTQPLDAVIVVIVIGEWFALFVRKIAL